MSCRSLISFGTSERIESSGCGFGTNVPAIHWVLVAREGTVPEIVDKSDDSAKEGVVVVNKLPCRRVNPLGGFGFSDAYSVGGKRGIIYV